MVVTVASQGNIIHECDTNNWTNIGTVTTSDPDPIEFSGCLAVQVSLATELSYYVGTFNFSSKILYHWYTHRAALDSLANGGVCLYAYDGVNGIAYHVGGKDKAVFRHDDGPSLWQCVAIDTDNPPSTYTVLSGSEASLNWGALTRIGWRVKTLAKSIGGAVNVFYDIMRYRAAGQGLLITGGTSGAPGSFAEVAVTDRATGDQKAFGVLRELGLGLYGVQGSLNFGTASADSWFEDDGFALVFEARGFLDDKLFITMTGGEVTYENHFVLANGTIKSAESAVTIDFSNSNVTEIDISGCTIETKGGTISCANDSYATAGHIFTGCKFYACGQIDPGTATFTDCSISNSTDSATGALLLDSDGSDNLSYLNFISGGSGHAIYITSAGEYDLSDFTYSGYGATGTGDAVIYNNSGGHVIINVNGGDTPTYLNGVDATTEVNSSVDLEINGLTEGSSGVVIGSGGAEDGNVLMSGYADSAGKIEDTFGGATPQNVIIRCRNGGIIAAAVQEDNGTGFTDYTNDARSLTGSPGIGSTNDVLLLPTTPAANDAFYFGGLTTFGELVIEITTAGTNYSGDWEYYNGSWTALTTTDETTSFKTSDVGKVSFTVPDDWTTTTINSQGPFYYIRFVVTSVSSPTQPKADSISLNKTTKYLPFNGTGQIVSDSGLTVAAVWLVDDNNKN